MVRVAVLGSGSRGNALVVELGSTRVVVDAGFGLRSLAQRFRTAGVVPGSVAACVVTHEHVDHASGAQAAHQRWGWKLLSTRPTLAAMRVDLSAGGAEATEYGEPFDVGEVRITLFPVSHDAAAPSAALIESYVLGVRVGIAHDLGAVPASLARSFERLDLLVLEANHDVGMLRAGPYPPFLQERILSRTGHLSNAQAAGFAAYVAHRGLRAVVLAHLSEQNNTPKIALSTVACALRRTAFRGKLIAAAQDAACAVGDRRDDQLRLF